MLIPGLPTDLVQRVVERVRSAAVDPVAVLVTGSYAAGTATPTSDLDVTGLYTQAPAIRYSMWFEKWAGDLLHVSAGAKSLDKWLRDRDEPAAWSLGFPTDEAALLLWATDAARSRLGDPPVGHRPAGDPELEDFFESALKVKRALARADHLGARWHAHDMARLAPRLLLRLNPARRVTTRRDALDAALAVSTAPTTYTRDLAVCLGVVSAPDVAFTEAATRLPRELIAFLREQLPDVDPQPALTRYVVDGTLERQLAR